jgi:hypothetical protein
MICEYNRNRSRTVVVTIVTMITAIVSLSGLDRSRIPGRGCTGLAPVASELQERCFVLRGQYRIAVDRAVE